jgi:hypothetical protein
VVEEFAHDLALSDVALGVLDRSWEAIPLPTHRGNRTFKGNQPASQSTTLNPEPKCHTTDTATLNLQIPVNFPK